MSQGIIYVSKCLFPYTFRPETLADWKKALLLPDGYGVAEVNSSTIFSETWQVTVESDAIPANDDRQHLPMVAPIYRSVLVDEATREYRPELERIEMRVWDGSTYRELDGVA